MFQIYSSASKQHLIKYREIILFIISSIFWKILLILCDSMTIIKMSDLMAVDVGDWHSTQSWCSSIRESWYYSWLVGWVGRKSFISKFWWWPKTLPHSWRVQNDIGIAHLIVSGERERRTKSREREGSIIIKLFLENEVLKAFEEVLIKLDIRLSPIFSKFRHSFKTHTHIHLLRSWMETSKSLPLWCNFWHHMGKCELRCLHCKWK